MKIRAAILIIFAVLVGTLLGYFCAYTETYSVYALENTAEEGSEDDSNEEGDEVELPCIHAWDGGRTEVAAKCTSSGMKVFTCIHCGETQEETIPATGHNYEITVLKQATCSETGRKRYYCLNCGNEYDEVIPATSHNYKKTAVTGDPNYCVDWKYECQDCGEFYYELTGTEERAVHEISNASAFLDISPGCTTVGMRVGTCSVCGETGSVAVMPLGHEWIVESQTYDAETDKTTVYYFCSRCGENKAEEITAEEGGQSGIWVGLNGILNHVAEYYQNSIYGPYRDLMLMLFGIFAGVWGIPVGISYIIARKQDDKEKAKKMLVNFVVGIVVSFCLLVAAPFLVNVFMQIILSLT